VLALVFVWCLSALVFAGIRVVVAIVDDDEIRSHSLLFVVYCSFQSR